MRVHVGPIGVVWRLLLRFFIRFPDERRDETGRRNARTDEFVSNDVGRDAIALGTRGGGVGAGGGCAAKRRRGARAVAEHALDD